MYKYIYTKKEKRFLVTKIICVSNETLARIKLKNGETKMGLKSPSTSYYENKMKITGRSELITEWLNAPIGIRDRELLADILDKKSLQELADKYNITVSGITKWKKKLFEQLHRYDRAKLKYSPF